LPRERTSSARPANVSATSSGNYQATDNRHRPVFPKTFDATPGKGQILLLDRQITELLSSPGCKNILRALRLTAAPNQWLSRTVPFRQEGRIARRHERGTGCGGRESVRRAMAVAGRAQTRERFAACETNDAFLRTAKSCGPDTRCWCQVRGGKSARPGSMSL
jgi:hypothetical protein